MLCKPACKNYYIIAVSWGIQQKIKAGYIPIATIDVKSRYD